MSCCWKFCKCGFELSGCFWECDCKFRYFRVGRKTRPDITGSTFSETGNRHCLIGRGCLATKPGCKQHIGCIRKMLAHNRVVIKKIWKNILVFVGSEGGCQLVRLREGATLFVIRCAEIIPVLNKRFDNYNNLICENGIVGIPARRRWACWTWRCLGCQKTSPAGVPRHED